ncbi:MAG: hypothetical protein CTY16_09360 [Methylobacter sp.]|nr:MAG: hypothetical protein CTY16_09360 [Methylobacter sp.]
MDYKDIIITKQAPCLEESRSRMLNWERRHLIVPAVLLGLLTGIVSAGFQLSLDYGETMRNLAIDWAHQQPNFGFWAIMGLSISAVFLSAGLAIQFSPEASGGGIPHLKAVLKYRCTFRWFRVLVVKFISTLIGGSAGLMVGSGGPTVHMGGAIGQGITNLWPEKNYTKAFRYGGGWRWCRPDGGIQLTVGGLGVYPRRTRLAVHIVRVFYRRHRLPYC